MSVEKLRKEKTQLENRKRQISDILSATGKLKSLLKKESNLNKKIGELQPEKNELIESLRQLGNQTEDKGFGDRLVSELLQPFEFDPILRHAQDIFNTEKRAISVTLLTKRLKLDRDQVKTSLENAKSNDKYDAMLIDFGYYKFYAYYPKDEILPYLPRQIKPDKIDVWNKLSNDLKNEIDKKLNYRPTIKTSDLFPTAKNYQDQLGVSFGILRSCINLYLIYLEQKGYLRRDTGKREWYMTIK